MNVVICINCVVYDVCFIFCDSIIDDFVDFVIIENIIIVCSFVGCCFFVCSVVSCCYFDWDGIDVDIFVVE